MHFEGIPENTNLLIMEYSDHDYDAMDNGGHGKFDGEQGTEVTCTIVLTGKY